MRVELHLAGPSPAQRVLLAIERELKAARLKHAPMHSAHEGHSVIREELDELWAHVKADTGGSAEAREEAIQLATMAVRYVLDVCDEVPQ